MADYRRLRLIGCNGDQIDLRSDTYRTMPEVVLGTANVGLQVDNTLLGRRKRSAKHERLLSSFRVAVLADTADEHDTARRRLLAALTATPENDVLLIHERADGTSVAVAGTCVTTDFGAIQGEDDTYSVLPVAHEANEAAYWTSLEAAIAELSIGVDVSTTPWIGHQPIGADVPIGWPWFIGGRYISDAPGQTITVTNDGDMMTWPDWTVTGPANRVDLAHRRTGKVFAWNGSLLAGETMRIVTDPKRRAVTIGQDPAWVDVELYSQMSELLKGDNIIEVHVGGGDLATTTIKLTAYPRFVAP